MAKVFEVAFRISGAMSGQFAAAMRAAQNSMRALSSAAASQNATMSQSAQTLQRYLAQLNQVSQNAAKFAQLKQELISNQQAMQQATQKTGGLAREYRAQQQAASALKARLDALKAAYESQKGALPRSELQALRAEIKSVTQEWKAAEQGVKAAGRAFESSKNNARGLKETLQAQMAQLQSLRAQLSAAGFSTREFASSEQRLRSEIESTTRALERQAQVEQRLQNARARSQAATQNLGMSAAGVMGAVYSAQQMAQPFKDAIDNAMTFEHAMSKVKALTQSENIRFGNFTVVETEMARLERQARELGATTQFTMTQAAEAMVKLGMSGWKTEQIYNAMPGMLDLAAGAGADLARTADIVSDNMTAMGLTAGQTVRAGRNLEREVEASQHFMDVYAYALTNSNVDLESLGATMKYAAPIAAAYGATLEDIAAMTMMMGNAGIKDTMAGTALRMGLLRLSGPPKKASKEMEALGISMSDATAMAFETQAMLQSLGVSFDENAPPADKMNQVLMQLSEKMQGLSREEKLAAVGAIFGANAASGWVNILEQGPDVFQKYRDALYEADGYSRQFAQIMNDDTRGAMIALESATDAVQNSIGTALLPTVRQAAEALTPLATSFSIWIGQNPQIVQGVAAIAASLSGLMILAAGVKLAFASWSFITAQVELVQASLAAMAAGTTPLAARFVALRATMLSTFASMRALTWSSIGASIAAGFNGVMASVAAARVAVMSFFTSLSASSVAATVTAALQSVGAAIMSVGRAAMAFAISPLGIALMALGLAAVYVYQNWDRLAPVFSNLASVITGTLSSAIETLSPALQTLQAAFGSLMASLSNSGVLSALGSAFSGLAKIIGGALVGAFVILANVAVGALTAVINIFATLMSTAANVVAEIINLVSNVLAGEWSAAWENLKNIVVTVFEGLADIILAPFKAIGDTIGNITRSFEIFSASRDVASGEAVRRHAITPSSTETTNVSVDTTQAQSQITELGSAAAQSAMTVQQNATANETAVMQAAQTVEAASAASQTIQQTAMSASTANEQVQQTAAATTEANMQVQQSIAEVSTVFAETSAATTAFNAEVQNSVSNITANSQSFLQNTSEVTANSQSFQQNTVNVAANNTAIQQNTAHLQASAAGLASFNGALASTNGGLNALSANSSSAASAVQSLGSAAQTAVSAMQSAASSIASAAASASAGKPAANAKGGIYQKGAFLTWFAEESPEAAIPLDKSQRAINLWQRAGQMLGVLPSESFNQNSIARHLTVNNSPLKQKLIGSSTQNKLFSQNSIARHLTVNNSPLKQKLIGSSTQNALQTNAAATNINTKIGNSTVEMARLTNEIERFGNVSSRIKTAATTTLNQVEGARRFGRNISFSQRQNLNNNATTAESFRSLVQAKNFTAENGGGQRSAGIWLTADNIETLNRAVNNNALLQQQTAASLKNTTNAKGGDAVWNNTSLVNSNADFNTNSAIARENAAYVNNLSRDGESTARFINSIYSTVKKIERPMPLPSTDRESTQNQSIIKTIFYPKSRPTAMTAGGTSIMTALRNIFSSQTMNGGGTITEFLREINSGKVSNIDATQMPPVTVNVNITINGKADEREVERGVRQAIPAMTESFTRQMSDWLHERQRVSYG